MLPQVDPMLPTLYQIEKVTKETEDTFTLALNPAQTDGLPPFQPGQFNMLYIYGVGEVPISISGDPAIPRTLVHTTRAVGTVTRAMKQLKKDQQIGIRGPYGSHWPVTEAIGDDIVLVAGGIGLAPLRPALYQVLAMRERFGKVVLLYGTRTPEDILFKKELENWRKRFDLEVYVTVDRATGNWYGNVGVVPSLIPKAPFDPHQTTAMICGPEVMMRFTVHALQNRGMATQNIYVSMERNMKCAIGLCGHCQLGPTFICKDGPVYRFDVIERLFDKREL
ncbi:MAG: FAD/NAD(P)-binding protein [Calditrichae bacterium]|nr:FAD/NAD(P)-binding protein [Calditrichia bacterium]